jgi:flagellin-like protein
MMRDSTGVSPVVATILLIAITVVAVGVVMAFVAGLHMPTTPVSSSITVENAASGNTRIMIVHRGGDPLLNAKTNVQVRVNGVNENAIIWTLADNTNFKVGDVIYVENINLSSGDLITVVYIPTSQTVVTQTVP